MTTIRMSTTKIRKKTSTKEPEVIDEDGFTLVTKKRAARGIPPITQQLPENQDAPSDEEEDEHEENDEDNKEEDEEKQQQSEEQKEESSDDETDNDEEESKPQRPRLARELRALGITPTDSESVNTINETTREVYSAITSDTGVPSTFEEAFFVPMSHIWIPAVYEELMGFSSRKAFKKRHKEHVKEQLRRKLMTTKWIFKEKDNLDGTMKYKARCVSRGFMQIPEVDYTESFSPVASDTGIRVVSRTFLYYLHMFPRDEWVLETFDVEVAFLNALLSNP
jgi:Reverse transcriptase (RNA-dependent DNA polymerase)